MPKPKKEKQKKALLAAKAAHSNAWWSLLLTKGQVAHIKKSGVIWVGQKEGAVREHLTDVQNALVYYEGTGFHGYFTEAVLRKLGFQPMSKEDVRFVFIPKKDSVLFNNV